MRRRLPPARKVAESAVFHLLKTATLLVRVVPTKLLLPAADVVAFFVFLIDARGRRVGRQNLNVILERHLSSAEKRRLLMAATRGSVRSIAITLHASPLTPERVRRWVDIPVEVETLLREEARNVGGAVVISGHLGNWEILLGLAGVFRDVMPTTFLFEPNTLPGLDRFLDWLRGSGSGASASRKGGALALSHHVKRGGIAGILVDRNARRRHGGIWVPFCGLLAATTPLPAQLSRRFGVPIVPLYCLPIGDGRYQIELGARIDEGLHAGAFQDDIREMTRRINAQMETRIRRHPEAWNWTLKRFKSRPTREQGPYPPYSLFDPGI